MHVSNSGSKARRPGSSDRAPPRLSSPRGYSSSDRACALRLARDLVGCVRERLGEALADRTGDRDRFQERCVGGPKNPRGDHEGVTLRRDLRPCLASGIRPRNQLCRPQAASFCAGATSKPTRGKCTFTFPTEGSSCRMTISSAVQASIAPCTGLP
jgi:hypothetical protein